MGKSDTGRNLSLLVLSSVFLSHGVIQGQSDKKEKIDNLNAQIQIKTLKEGQPEIRKDLLDIKELLRTQLHRQRTKRPSLTGKYVNINSFFNFSSINSIAYFKLTLIEFSDYQCTFCARHVRETLSKLNSEYIQTGKLKYVVRDLPLAQNSQTGLQGSRGNSLRWRPALRRLSKDNRRSAQVGLSAFYSKEQKM